MIPGGDRHQRLTREVFVRVWRTEATSPRASNLRSDSSVLLRGSPAKAASSSRSAKGAAASALSRRTEFSERASTVRIRQSLLSVGV